jgi:hypothetical protein
VIAVTADFFCDCWVLQFLEQVSSCTDMIFLLSAACYNLCVSKY